MRRIAAGLDIDKVVGAGVVARMTGTLVAPISALSIVGFLTLKEQGYWYALASVVAIASYAELGAGQVTMQLAAHEWVNAREGVSTNLRSVLTFAVLWSIAVGLTIPLFGLGIGAFVLNGQPRAIWLGPLILMLLVAPLAVTLAIVNSFVEGCQQIATAQLRRAAQSAVYLLGLILALSSGAGLWALGLAQLASAACGLTMIVLQNRSWLLRLIATKGLSSLNWTHDVWPLQWRYAVTWVTGILVFNLFTPLLMRLKGPEAAGKFGFSMSLAMMLAGFSQIWIVARAAQFSRLTAARQWARLRHTFRASTLRSFSVFFVGSLAILVASPLLINIWPRLGQRLLPWPVLAVLLLAIGVNMAITAITTFVRSFREEPFVGVAWVNAALSLVLVPALVGLHGAAGAAGALLLTQSAVLPACMRIKRRYEVRITAESSGATPP